MPNLDYYNTARMHQMVNSFQNILDYIISSLFLLLDVVLLILKGEVVTYARKHVQCHYN